MDRTKAIIAQIISLVATIVLYLIARITRNDVALFLAFIPMIAFFVFSFFNRCPTCGRFLGRHHIFIEYCPYCGNYL